MAKTNFKISSHKRNYKCIWCQARQHRRLLSHQFSRCVRRKVDFTCAWLLKRIKKKVGKPKGCLHGQIFQIFKRIIRYCRWLFASWRPRWVRIRKELRRKWNLAVHSRKSLCQTLRRIWKHCLGAMSSSLCITEWRSPFWGPYKRLWI